MINLDTIGEGIAKTLAAGGIRTYDQYVDSPTPPCAYPVLIPPLELNPVFGSNQCDVTFAVVLLVPFVDDRSAINTLNALIDTAVAAIETDPTLASTVNDAVAARISAYGDVGDDRRWLSARLDIEIYTGR